MGHTGIRRRFFPGIETALAATQAHPERAGDNDEALADVWVDVLSCDGTARSDREVPQAALPGGSVLIAPQNDNPLPRNAILVKVTEARHRVSVLILFVADGEVGDVL
jgi:hypothetical protein